MMDGPDTGPEFALRQGAAFFLSQALGLEDAPESLAEDLSPIKRDTNAGIFTIQLESMIGPAAFIVYAYVLARRGGDGHTGKELFDAGLQTLQQAARYETPGPRALAHAESGEYGYILATTPGTYRALIGGAEAEPADDEAPTIEPISVSDAHRIRSETAERLLDILKAGNEQASLWLDAIRVIGQEDGADGAILDFNESETELALYLLDERSIENLLQTLNLFVATAQEHAARALHDAEHDDSRRV